MTLARIRNGFLVPQQVWAARGPVQGACTGGACPPVRLCPQAVFAPRQVCSAAFFASTLARSAGSWQVGLRCRVADIVRVVPRAGIGLDRRPDARLYRELFVFWFVLLLTKRMSCVSRQGSTQGSYRCLLRGTDPRCAGVGLKRRQVSETEQSPSASSLERQKQQHPCYSSHSYHIHCLLHLLRRSTTRLRDFPWKTSGLQLKEVTERTAYSGISRRNLSRNMPPVRRWTVNAGKLVLEWKDKSVSRFPVPWLLDHQKSNWHASTNQKINPASSLTEDLLEKYRILDVTLDRTHKEINVHWADNKTPSVFPVNELKHRSTLHSRWGLPDKQPWKTLPKNLPMSSANLDKSTSQQKILSDLAVYGFHMVTNMPATIQETEAFTRDRLGPPRETFYGGMWDTAPRNDQINDTAYTYDALDPHTDTCYLIDSPGLQIFNCVAQDTGEGGRTRLVDTDMVVTILKSSYPDTFRFFAEKPLVFHHTENSLFARVCSPAIALEYDGSLKQFRYNEYDLAPLDYMSDGDVDAFYHHNRILVDVIRECEQSIKLQVGQMMIIDNHRVMHGRTAFKGFRNLIGCYVGADDWIMRARSLFSVLQKTTSGSHQIDESHWKHLKV